MKSDRIELPADKELVEKFIRDSTKEESDHFVYVLECDGWIEEKARRRAKDLHPPKTKEDLREYQKENNFENWKTFSERKKKRFLERESGFSPPSWYYRALDAERVYYVGYTANVYSRINQHIEGTPSNGAHFTKVFPPTHLVEVYGFQNQDRAYEAENEVAIELTENESYAYSF